MVCHCGLPRKIAEMAEMKQKAERLGHDGDTSQHIRLPSSVSSSVSIQSQITEVQHGHNTVGCGLSPR